MGYWLIAHCTNMLKQRSQNNYHKHSWADIIIITVLFCSLYLVSFCLVCYRSFIILPFSLLVCLTVQQCAVFNMLRGHMSTAQPTHYFVSVHSSVGPIHVLAFCCCYTWWGFLHCPTGGETRCRGFQLRLTITLIPAIILSGLLLYLMYRTVSVNR